MYLVRSAIEIMTYVESRNAKTREGIYPYYVIIKKIHVICNSERGNFVIPKKETLGTTIGQSYYENATNEKGGLAVETNFGPYNLLRSLSLPPQIIGSQDHVFIEDI